MLTQEQITQELIRKLNEQYHIFNDYPCREFAQKMNKNIKEVEENINIKSEMHKHNFLENKEIVKFLNERYSKNLKPWAKITKDLLQNSYEETGEEVFLFIKEYNRLKDKLAKFQGLWERLAPERAICQFQYQVGSNGIINPTPAIQFNPTEIQDFLEMKLVENKSLSWILSFVTRYDYYITYLIVKNRLYYWCRDIVANDEIKQKIYDDIMEEVDPSEEIKVFAYANNHYIDENYFAFRGEFEGLVINHRKSQVWINRLHPNITIDKANKIFSLFSQTGHHNLEQIEEVGGVIKVTIANTHGGKQIYSFNKNGQITIDIDLPF